MGVVGECTVGLPVMVMLAEVNTTRIDTAFWTSMVGTSVEDTSK